MHENAATRHTLGKENASFRQEKQTVAIASSSRTRVTQIDF